MATIRCLLALTPSNRWVLHQLDVNNVFLHGDLSGDVYMHVPDDILNPFNKVSTPFPLNLKLTASAGDLLHNSELYRSLVGKLNFVTNTRPDLAYAVQSRSQFMQQPHSSHLSALLHNLRYVAHTIGQGTLLLVVSNIKLQAFSDSE
ncbi:hypothetical protein AgCh_024226 [Apium graveolens]